jgi:hypothetical protein
MLKFKQYVDEKSPDIHLTQDSYKTLVFPKKFLKHIKAKIEYGKSNPS